MSPRFFIKYKHPKALFHQKLLLPFQNYFLLLMCPCIKNTILIFHYIFICNNNNYNNDNYRLSPQFQQLFLHFSYSFHNDGVVYLIDQQICSWRLPATLLFSCSFIYFYMQSKCWLYQLNLHIYVLARISLFLLCSWANILWFFLISSMF